MAKNEVYRILSPSHGASIGEPGQTCLWGFQPHQHASLQGTAESLFNEQIPNAAPEFAYIAIKVSDEEGPIAIVEPMSGTLDADDFVETLSLHKSIEKLSPRIPHYYAEGDPHGEAYAKRGEDQQSSANLWDAVLKTIEYRCVNEHVASFLGPSIDLGPYRLYCALLVRKSVLDNYRSLGRRSDVRFVSVDSFVDSLAKQFLISASRTTRQSIDENLICTPADCGEILRAAATEFMHIPFAYIGDSMTQNAFDVFNSLSTLTYEQNKSTGEIILTKRGHRNIRVSLGFAHVTSLHDYRSIRKLLELAVEGDSLLCDRRGVYGTGRIVGSYNACQLDLFQIRLLSQFKWEIVHNGTTLLRSEFGNPFVYKDEIRIEQFVEMFRRRFAVTDQRKEHCMQEIANWASKLRKGTILVICQDAEKESNRFATQSLKIDPCKMSESLLEKSSRIDGASLVDSNGVCHAIGVILDGQAVTKGRKDRGARYNSAVRYVHSQSNPCVAMVISDDGMIDVVPEFRPQLSRNLLEDKLELVKEMRSRESIRIPEFNELLSWFESNRDYLTKENCDQLNETFPSLESKCSGSEFRKVYSKLLPNHEVDETWYTR